MKKNYPSFEFKDSTVICNYKKLSIEPFDDVRKLSLNGKKLKAADKLNVIGVSKKLFPFFNNTKMLLLNNTNDKFINVSLQLTEGIEDHEFTATPYLKEVLDINESAELLLCSYKDLKFNRIFLQKIDHIRENDLVISKADYDNIPCNISGSPFSLFEVYNTFSHDSIVIKRSHIFVDDSLAPGTIRLNRKQRLCLGLELPQYLTPQQWKTITESIDENSEDINILYELYPSADRFLDKSAPYDKKAKGKKIISKYCAEDIRIIPIPESVHTKGKGLLRGLCDLYVGKSTISLVGRRPYDIDEGLDIVRMTRSNMNLLGIDEMDKVILQYKNKKISCRVLELGDEDAFTETNLPISPDLAVGIPAHIRKKLYIMDLSSSVKIDRDTGFIFKKSINEQIVPILLTLFSANLFTDSSVILSALLSIVAIPIVLYFNLSSKRNMRT